MHHAGGELGLAGVLRSAGLLGSSVPAELFAGQISSGLGPGQFFRPPRGLANRYDFLSSVTLDRAFDIRGPGHFGHSRVGFSPV